MIKHGTDQEPGVIAQTEKALTRKMQMKWLLLLSGPLLFLLTFYVYPIARMLTLSVFDPDFTMKHYIHLFEVPAYSRVLIETFKLAGSVTIICVILGYPVAYLLANTTSRMRNLLMVLVVMPFMTAILVRTYAWMVILGRHGLVNELMMGLGLTSSPVKLMHNLFGVYAGMVQILLPFMIFPIYSVMDGIDKRLMKAAESLGANPFQAFCRIFLPLSLPGVGGGCLLVFIVALGFFITPALLGGVSDVMISMFIETQVNTLLNLGFASAMSVVLLIITFILFSIYTHYFGMEKTFTG